MIYSLVQSDSGFTDRAAKDAGTAGGTGHLDPNAVRRCWKWLRTYRVYRICVRVCVYVCVLEIWNDDFHEGFHDRSQFTLHVRKKKSQQAAPKQRPVEQL